METYTEIKKLVENPHLRYMTQDTCVIEYHEAHHIEKGE